MVGVEYKPSQQTLTYAKVSSGFKSGAVNLGSIQPNLVKPEKVTAVELGLKTEFMDRRGTVNVAIFNSDYKDMQVSQVGTATVILANASKARIRGAEVEVVMRPVPELTLNATVGLMDPEYTDFVNTDIRNNPTQAVNVKGNQLSQVSKSQYAVGAEYKAVWGGYRITLASDYAWRSKFYFTEFNTADAVQSGYGLLNFSASLRPASGPWKVYATCATQPTRLRIRASSSPRPSSPRAGR
jgi:outer membrane receptor protein involved in Fe transport